MAFDLRVIVTGLCNLMIHPEDGGIAVLLVNATEPNADQLKLGMHHHTPFLGVKVGGWSEHHTHWHPNSIAPTLNGGAIGVFYLNNEELRIETPTPLQLNRAEPRARSPRTLEEESNLYWIPELPRLDDSYGGVDPACLSDF